jgi:hypothetical protein
LGFSILHVLVGCAVLWLLFAGRCVDDPCPPNAYCLDGCSARHDPWRDGYAPFFLGFIIVFILLSLGLLRASRFARVALVVVIAAYFAYGFYVSIDETKDLLDRVGEPHGWDAAWNERLKYLAPIEWLLPLCWVSFDLWFLFGSRARTHFARVA